VVNGAVDHSNIGSKRRYLVNNLAELKQGQAIDGTQDGVREAARGFQFELFRAYLGLGRWDAAGQHVAKANQLRPDDPQQHVVLGNIMLRERNADGALKEFQEALRLDPTGPWPSQPGKWSPESRRHCGSQNSIQHLALGA
jgi:lipoprotein NlpI